ncbi:family 43 glycosylhydrolase [Massilia rhizosphaerae]|uniref:family 43 glycosylhydrolase n=1 Tax=Massilia rhizosphaerae TaxID=2784389 RepID=UPI0018DE03A9
MLATLRPLAAMSAALLLTLAGVAGCAAERAVPPGAVAAKPLFRDPVYDGAADPTLVWNAARKRWWMFYTNRRATAQGLPGVSWVHGTRIGITESADGGAHWTYVGTADVELPPELGGNESTQWAPDVVRAGDGTYHMFLTVVPGVFTDWGHPRVIVHLTSTDLRTWRHPVKIPLANDKVIDPSLARLPDGTWRMWYNNERDGKTIYYADSPDLEHWTDRGLAVAQRGEGPKVFRWHDAWWMIVDVWHGLAVFRSDDALTWKKQAATLLEQPGHGLEDGVMGGHADVVVSGGRAWVFYFVHPGRRGPDAKRDGLEQRRSLIQVSELIEEGGIVRTDRDAPVHIRLDPPA